MEGPGQLTTQEDKPDLHLVLTTSKLHGIEKLVAFTVEQYASDPGLREAEGDLMGAGK